MSATAGSPAPGDEPGRYVVRARRRADLSQRELAALVGISASTVSRIESGAVVPSIALYVRLLALAGLRLLVVDREGHEVLPVPRCPSNAGPSHATTVPMHAPGSVTARHVTSSPTTPRTASGRPTTRPKASCCSGVD